MHMLARVQRELRKNRLERDVVRNVYGIREGTKEILHLPRLCLALP